MENNLNENNTQIEEKVSLFIEENFIKILKELPQLLIQFFDKLQNNTNNTLKNLRNANKI